MERGRNHCTSHPLGLRLGWISRVGAIRDEMEEARTNLPVDFLFQHDVGRNASVCSSSFVV